MAARPLAPRRVRKAVLIAAIGVPVAVAAAVLVPMQAGAAVDLPDKTPAELIAFVHASDVDALSGTIEQTSELGLPDLDGLIGPMRGAEGPRSDAVDPADLDDLLALATGTHTANVFVDGERARLQVLDRLAERNVYLDGEAREAWFVDSETQTATRITVTGEVDPPSPEKVVPTPETMLDDALTKLDASTEVTVGTDGRVAGREVYELVLAPRTDDTLVGELRFAIDGETGVPLSASVTARGADAPAFSVTFTDIDFGAPDPAVLEFTPGAGVTVAERQIAIPDAGDRPRSGETGDHPEPIIHGEGWTAVIEVPAGEHAEDGSGTASEALEPDTLEAVTTPVEGGRVLQTSLVTVMFTDDGRVLAGAVPAERLVAIARTGR